jgi:DNA modification methylase
MLHPLLVDFLIKKYANKNDVIFDPFCGSGVTLLQSCINGYKSIGFDINPLALLIAKVKTQRYDKDKLLKDFEDFKADLITSNDFDVPEIKNINYWYSDSVINDLAKIRAVLKKAKYEYKDFFIVCYAYICRDQSFTRNGEFKRYRMKEEKVSNAENKVFDKLFKHIENMIDIFSISETLIEESRPILANSENSESPDIKYNLVITSPPY